MSEPTIVKVEWPLAPDKSDKLPVRITGLMTDHKDRIVATAEVVAILSIASLAIFRFSTVWGSFESYIWLALVGAFLVVAFVRLFGRISASNPSLNCDEYGLSFYRSAVFERRILYSDISLIRFQVANELEWMRIELRSGEVLTIRLFQFTTSRDAAEKSILQVMGPRLPADVVLERSPRPEDALAAFRYDSFFQLPTVPMQPNVWYRYRLKDELKRASKASNFDFFHHGLLPATFGSITTHSIWVLVVLLPIWGYIVRAWLARRQFKNSIDDRFRLVEGGLEVTRGDQTWVVPKPVSNRISRNRLAIFDGHAMRLGSGRNPYYFDPRFIEPDI